MAKYYRATQRGRSQFKNNVTMGKMFTTKKGRYGCYVYINGKRSHFEPHYGSRSNPIDPRYLPKRR
jgi:topoisomerase IA-like protein